MGISYCVLLFVVCVGGAWLWMRWLSRHFDNQSVIESETETED